MKKRIGIFAVLITALIVLGGCGSDKESTERDEEKLTVVTTFYPMYDFTRNIVQDRANVSMLIPAGTEPHDFEPSAKMIAQIENADVFVYNSDEMETWVPDALKAIDLEQVTVIKASEGITPIEQNKESEDDHTHATDPHVWLDPVLAQKETVNIRKGLAEADPQHAEEYEKAAQTYHHKLEELDKNFQEAFEGAEKRTFVSQHAAFSYLAARYDLRQLAIAGLSSEAEPSPATLAKLTRLVKENDIHYIYYEESASSAISKTLAQETDVKLEVLDPIEGVSNEDQEAGMDYISIMKQNLAALQKSIR